MSSTLGLGCRGWRHYTCQHKDMPEQGIRHRKSDAGDGLADACPGIKCLPGPLKLQDEINQKQSLLDFQSSLLLARETPSPQNHSRHSSWVMKSIHPSQRTSRPTRRDHEVRQEPFVQINTMLKAKQTIITSIHLAQMPTRLSIRLTLIGSKMRRSNPTRLADTAIQPSGSKIPNDRGMPIEMRRIPMLSAPTTIISIRSSTTPTIPLPLPLKARQLKAITAIKDITDNMDITVTTLATVTTEAPEGTTRRKPRSVSSEGRPIRVLSGSSHGFPVRGPWITFDSQGRV
ncbi:hypothetical protein F4780DRAFT_746363 [Xylariomycetidae sp. FL0641]|nr:hypothetical protein F4780DRAFT_746363 [Xylariomycetidae sp. FL0641]